MMIAGSPYHFPYEHGWLDARLDLRARLSLRERLRELLADTDARLALLWSQDTRLDRAIVETAGDTFILPSPVRLPAVELTVPSRDVVVDEHRETHDATTLRISMGGGVPRLGLGIIGAENAPSERLFDAIEKTAWGIERVIVDAVERAENAARKRSRDVERRREPERRR